MHSCEERIDTELARELAVIRRLVELWKQDPQAYDDDYGRFDEYGLWLNWYAPKGSGAEYESPRDSGYWCWLLTTGGPHAEFRFHVQHRGGTLDQLIRMRRVAETGIVESWPYLRESCFEIEYVYKDWWDVASRTLEGEDREFMLEVFELLMGTEMRYQ